MNLPAYISGAGIIAFAAVMAGVMVPAYRQHRREMREPVLIFDRHRQVYWSVVHGETIHRHKATAYTRAKFNEACLSCSSIEALPVRDMAA